MEGTEIETDREYALVVEEDALIAKAPEVDEHTGHEFEDDATIRTLLGDKDFIGAYREYCERLESDGASEFHADVEYALSEHFLEGREFREASHILEHHVATHAKQDVAPRVYFNLGYIHAVTGTYNKSRRFLRLFVDSESDPQFIARAKGILASLDSR